MPIPMPTACGLLNDNLRSAVAGHARPRHRLMQALVASSTNSRSRFRTEVSACNQAISELTVAALSFCRGLLACAVFGR